MLVDLSQNPPLVSHAYPNRIVTRVRGSTRSQVGKVLSGSNNKPYFGTIRCKIVSKETLTSHIFWHDLEFEDLVEKWGVFLSEEEKIEEVRRHQYSVPLKVTTFLLDNTTLKTYWIKHQALPNKVSLVTYSLEDLLDVKEVMRVVVSDPTVKKPAFKAINKTQEVNVFERLMEDDEPLEEGYDVT